MIDAYSVPCKPDTSARTAPGLEPRITATGIEVAASTPPGTSMKPVAFSPGAADAVPTLKLACPTAAPEISIKKAASIIQCCFIALTEGFQSESPFNFPERPILSASRLPCEVHE